MQGLKAIGRVIVSAGIAKQGLPARRGIAVTGEVGRQSLITIGCVVAPCAIVVQRGRTNRGVLGSGRIIKKCDSTDRRVVVGGGVLRKRGNTHGGVGIAGSIFRKRAGTRGRVGVAAEVVKERSVANGRVEAANKDSTWRAGVFQAPSIVKESKRSVSRVGSSNNVAEKCSRTRGCVFTRCYIHKERPGANGGVEVSFCVAEE